MSVNQRKLSEWLSLGMSLWILALIPLTVRGFSVIFSIAQELSTEKSLYAGIFCALIYCIICVQLLLREQVYTLILIKRKSLQKLKNKDEAPLELRKYMNMLPGNTLRFTINTILLISMFAAPTIAHNWIFEKEQADFMLTYHTSLLFSIMLFGQFIFPILFMNGVTLNQHNGILKDYTQ